LSEKPEVLQAGSGIQIEDSTINSVYTGDEFIVNVNIGSLEAGKTKIEKG
jgi:hypothetical protein